MAERSRCVLSPGRVFQTKVCGEVPVTSAAFKERFSEIQKLKANMLLFPLPYFHSFPNGCPNVIAGLRDRRRSNRLAANAVASQYFRDFNSNEAFGPLCHHKKRQQRISQPRPFQVD